MTRPRRPLSNKASTDSCSIRFSLRTIISGARKSIRRFRRLLRFITRRYKSFKSEVANRPPSSGTSGRNSGGITGRTSKIIHSGFDADSMKASTNLSLLTSFLRLASEPVLASSTRISSRSCSRSTEVSKRLIASAPMPASKASSPYSSCACKYCSSVKVCLYFKGVRPGSITI